MIMEELFRTIRYVSYTVARANRVLCAIEENQRAMNKESAFTRKTYCEIFYNDFRLGWD